MKVLSIELFHIGIIDHEKIEINEPLVIFYGDVKAGKTTLLNAPAWLGGNSIPKDIIKHGEKEAFIEMILDCGKIRREFYVNKKGEFAAREIKAVVNNSILKQKEVALLFNPFLLDQNYFTNMNSIDKAKFLIEIFGIETDDLDAKIKALLSECVILRTKVGRYGEIDVTEVKEPELALLRSRESTIKADIAIKTADNRKANALAQTNHNTEVAEYNTAVSEWEKKQDLRTSNRELANTSLKSLSLLGYKGCEVITFITELPEAEEKHALIEPILKDPIPETPDQAELEAIQLKISTALAEEILFNQYKARVAKKAEKKAVEDVLAAKIKTGKSLKAQKKERLSVVSGKIEGLVFDENGDFKYLNTSSAMLSDSMQMELSSKLSALYPEGLEIELIDRGESLGSSIYDLIDHAEKNNRNVLVSVVGQNLGVSKDKVGVFYLNDGKIINEEIENK